MQDWLKSLAWLTLESESSMTMVFLEADFEVLEFG